MSEKNVLKPDYLFEVSWEVCNKIGGIYTVISTKALSLSNELKDNYICIGPDVWKETHLNPEFEEDKFLFRSWRKHAEKQGLHFRIGRWNIPGNPIAILVDFTPLFSSKDKIFTDFWLKFGLNSLSGQWDYTEPAMFGYAAGQIIESFYEYNLTSRDRIIAHFHEWMTGTGVLYVKDKLPQVGTVFTTHATTIGRSISGNNLPLYKEMHLIDADRKANELGVTSKHSLEKIAAENADSFTTVSELTKNECAHLLGKTPDVVTPNGFDDSFVPSDEQFEAKRQKARNALLKVARGLLNQNLPDNTLLVANSGRYEFKNKGIDLFIDALGELNRKNPDRNLVAFILVPANQSGVRPDVVKRIENPDYNNPLSAEYSTHVMVDEAYDPSLRRIRENNLTNGTNDKVKIIFIPAYLNGSDGALNLNYYDTLIGLDLTVFPSYYEPWGYTPLESLAFYIPTITTSLAGFGLWVNSLFGNAQPSVEVIERNDDNDKIVAAQLSATLLRFLKEYQYSTHKGLALGEELSIEQVKAMWHTDGNLDLRQKAFLITRTALWKNLIRNYFISFNIALEKTQAREHLFRDKKQPIKAAEFTSAKIEKPKWKKVLVEVNIPEKFADLQRISRNLWWCWNYEATELFQMIDPQLWEKSEKNPIRMLENITLEQYNELDKNQEFIEKYNKVVADFNAYMDATDHKKGKQIAYFSMEYGLHESIKIYSGGLGVLAGDYLKQASDDNVNMVGIGLLYRYGYFTQNLSISGDQLATYSPHNFTYMSAQPVRNENGEWVKISIAFPGRTLHAKIWRIDVGRIPLYLLDTDIPENGSFDRVITHQLYGGDWENRFKQEFLLGIGGIRLLDALNLNPQVYHLNEGHAAFAGLERLRKLVQDEQLAFYEAIEVVRATSLFTTHTPVPAGHDHFSEDMLRTYMPHYAERLTIGWDTFMNLGKMHEDNPNEHFSMSVLATKLAAEVNGVSRIHGRVSQDMFKDMYPGYFANENHIGYVTNGVHYQTWTAKVWQELYKNTFGENFISDCANTAIWEKIYQVKDETIWDLRKQQRKALVSYIKERLLANMTRRQETPNKIFKTIESLDENALTIGFARRFATYKRAHLLFNDLERLSRIVNKEGMPVQFIFAGKAHPADKAGQDLIKNIVDISKRKEFNGKVIFLEDYDMELGRMLTQCVDIWLNTPTRPLEASGTSGQKAVLNGVMNFSVLDGWWAEGYLPEAGWAIKEEKTFDNQLFQDELDAETIYTTFENEIIPLFYNRNQEGIPVEWVKYVKKCIAAIAPVFTNKRMLDDYIAQYYNKIIDRHNLFTASHYAVAREFAEWKSQVIRGWDSIEVVKKDVINTADQSLMLGELFKAEISIDLNELANSDFGIEVVFMEQTFDNTMEIASVYQMEQTAIKDKTVTFKCEIPVHKAGIFNYAFRMFPKHPNMAHRQDFSLVKWL